MGPLLLLLAAASARPDAVWLQAEPGVIAAAKALGPDVELYTARARPLRTLRELRDPASEVGTAEVAGAREIQALLRAGGVKVSGGAVDLMRLVSVHHFPSLFRARPQLRLFVVRARADGRQREIAERGGGVKVQLAPIHEDPRPPSLPADGPPGGGDGLASPTPSASPTRFITSFGPLLSAELSPTARHRTFDAQDGARKETRTARPGHTFVVLQLERDFTLGVGLISFLYGSGIIVKPEYDHLSLVDEGRRSHPLSATHAEGRAVELAFEVPAGATGLALRDGDTVFSLAPLIQGTPAARN